MAIKASEKDTQPVPYPIPNFNRTSSYNSVDKSPTPPVHHPTNFIMYTQFSKEEPEIIVARSSPAAEGLSSIRAQNAVNGRNTTKPGMDPNNHPKPPGPTVAGYLDRITIAGLHNYLYATDFYEKVVWILTFLVAIVGTMFYLVPTIQQYLEYTIVLDIQHRIEPGLILPPVWVCTPGINFTYHNEQYYRVRPQLLVDKRMKVIADRFVNKFNRVYDAQGSTYVYVDPRTSHYETRKSVWNSEENRWETTPEDEVDAISLHARLFVTFSEVSESSEVDNKEKELFQEILQFLALSIEMAETNWTGYKAFYEEGMFQCESVVRNCNLNGIPFDCCRADLVGRVRGAGKCFKVDLPTEATALHLHPNQTSKFVLSLETVIDSADLSITGIGDATTGDISFGNRMSSLFEYGEFLGAGSISTITVRGIKKIEEANCTDKFRSDPRNHIYSHPIIRGYFEEMSDPKEYTVGACEIGKLLEALYVQCGCVLYYDTMRPQNDSVICRPQHIHACIYEGFQDTGSNDKASSMKPSTSASEGERATQDLLRAVKETASKECLPLCETWSYDFTSTSMASEGEPGNVTRYFRSKAIIIFDAEYRVEQEVYKMDYHALIASLGDGFGLILGISAITLIQLPIWALAAVLLRTKLNRITPLHGRQSSTSHVHTTVA